MGSCQSCLGRRRSSQGEDNETSRLLSDDPYRASYGARAAGGGASAAARSAYQPDPESVRREREALDGIAHAMSDHVIDVFTAHGHANGGPLEEATVPAAAPCNTPPSPAATAGRPADGDLGGAEDEVRLRTIKKGRGGPIFSALQKDASGLRAVQDAIG